MTEPLIYVYCRPIFHHGIPAIELRRIIRLDTADLRVVNVMQIILGCAFKDIPIVILPCFDNKMAGLNSMIQKGFVYKKANNDYRFSITDKRL